MRFVDVSITFMFFFFFASPKKETKKTSLTIKISENPTEPTATDEK